MCVCVCVCVHMYIVELAMVSERSKFSSKGYLSLHRIFTHRAPVPAG